MFSYKAPLNEMSFLLNDVFLASMIWSDIPNFADVIDVDVASDILTESSKFAENIIYPVNRSGDEQGVSFKDKSVITPEGYKKAFEIYAQNGWVGLCGSPDYGGMGMPKVLGVLVDEMAFGASNAFALFSSLTAGAAICINAHAEDNLKKIFLPKLNSGEWTAAMDMTESQAGSDLKHITTKAVPLSDGCYSISGSKIFITGGDHDLTNNIVHLVLAKLPNANNLSLFLVPKRWVNADGSLSDKNGVEVISIEQKMGIKASPTCAVNFDGAKGYLIGKSNRGLIYMFTMINYERLSIGIQGLASSQAAYQMALDYAKNRHQGQGSKIANKDSASIIVHGDVRRMLMIIKSLTDAGRAFLVYLGLQIDLANYSQNDQQKKSAKQYTEFLTPVAKAFLTDRGFESTVLAQQIFGGHGYIRETGIEQLVRDSRIAQIYEGTNGIQAIDFLSRKVLGDNLAILARFFDELKSNMNAFIFSSKNEIQIVNDYFDQIISSAIFINTQKLTRPSLLNSCAVDFLDAFGYVLYGYFWLLMVEKVTVTENTSLINQKTHLKHFYFAKLLPKARYHLALVNAGDEMMMTLDKDLF